VSSTAVDEGGSETMRLSQTATVLGLSSLFAAASIAALPAGAQTIDTASPHAAYCGAWQNGVFIPNGNCVDETVNAMTTTTTTVVAAPNTEARIPGRVSGTITFVKGHLVTLQQSAQQLVINDEPGLMARETGKVAVGRQVVAHGYWRGGTFYATRLEGLAM
jgi:hypothetical protein